MPAQASRPALFPAQESNADAEACERGRVDFEARRASGRCGRRRARDHAADVRLEQLPGRRRVEPEATERRAEAR